MGTLHAVRVTTLVCTLEQTHGDVFACGRRAQVPEQAGTPSDATVPVHMASLHRSKGVHTIRAGAGVSIAVAGSPPQVYCWGWPPTHQGRQTGEVRVLLATAGEPKPDSWLASRSPATVCQIFPPPGQREEAGGAASIGASTDAAESANTGGANWLDVWTPSSVTLSTLADGTPAVPLILAVQQGAPGLCASGSLGCGATYGGDVSWRSGAVATPAGLRATNDSVSSGVGVIAQQYLNVNASGASAASSGTEPRADTATTSADSDASALNGRGRSSPSELQPRKPVQARTASAVLVHTPQPATVVTARSSDGATVDEDVEAMAWDDGSMSQATAASVPRCFQWRIFAQHGDGLRPEDFVHSSTGHNGVPGIQPHRLPTPRGVVLTEPGAASDRQAGDECEGPDAQGHNDSDGDGNAAQPPPSSPHDGGADGAITEGNSVKGSNGASAGGDAPQPESEGEEAMLKVEQMLADQHFDVDAAFANAVSSDSDCAPQRKPAPPKRRRRRKAQASHAAVATSTTITPRRPSPRRKTKAKEGGTSPRRSGRRIRRRAVVRRGDGSGTGERGVPGSTPSDNAASRSPEGRYSDTRPPRVSTSPPPGSSTFSLSSHGSEPDSKPASSRSLKSPQRSPRRRMRRPASTKPRRPAAAVASAAPKSRTPQARLQGTTAATATAASSSPRARRRTPRRAVAPRAVALNDAQLADIRARRTQREETRLHALAALRVARAEAAVRRRQAWLEERLPGYGQPLRPRRSIKLSPRGAQLRRRRRRRRGNVARSPASLRIYRRLLLNQRRQRRPVGTHHVVVPAALPPRPPPHAPTSGHDGGGEWQKRQQRWHQREQWEVDAWHNPPPSPRGDQGEAPGSTTTVPHRPPPRSAAGAGISQSAPRTAGVRGRKVRRHADAPPPSARQPSVSRESSMSWDGDRHGGHDADRSSALALFALHDGGTARAVPEESEPPPGMQSPREVLVIRQTYDEDTRYTTSADMASTPTSQQHTGRTRCDSEQGELCWVSRHELPLDLANPQREAAHRRSDAAPAPNAVQQTAFAMADAMEGTGTRFVSDGAVRWHAQRRPTSRRSPRRSARNRTSVGRRRASIASSRRSRRATTAGNESELAQWPRKPRSPSRGRSRGRSRAARPRRRQGPGRAGHVSVQGGRTKPRVDGAGRWGHHLARHDPESPTRRERRPRRRKATVSSRRTQGAAEHDSAGQTANTVSEATQGRGGGSSSRGSAQRSTMPPPADVGEDARQADSSDDDYSSDSFSEDVSSGDDSEHYLSDSDAFEAA